MWRRPAPSSRHFAATSKGITSRPWSSAQTSPIGSAQGSVLSGSAPRQTYPTPSAFRTGPAGPWSVTPVWSWIRSPLKASLRDAELLADAIAAGLGRGQPFDAGLAGHQRRRDAAIG